MRILEYFRVGSGAGLSFYSRYSVSKLGSRLTLGLGLFLASASAIAYQDIAGFASKSMPDELRWTAHAVQIPIGSTYAAQFSSDVDTPITGAVLHRLKVETIGGRLGGTSQPLSQPKSEALHKKSKGKKPFKVNRSLKGGRVISSTIKRPPAHFSAGSIVRKTSLMQRYVDKSRLKLAFKKFRKSVAPIQLAGVFLNRKPARTMRSPVIKPKILLASMRTRLKDSINPSALVAYAAVGKDNEAPFRALFGTSNKAYTRPFLGIGDHKWAINKLPLRSKSKGEQNCLTNGIYFEARGEPIRGQAAVAQVILNRVKNPTYPNSICKVVYQNKSWKNRCQFSFACDGIRDRVRSKKQWATAKAIAKQATDGKMWVKEVGSATHYHATYVRPRWARTMKRMKKIGQHIFYRTKGGGWS